MYVADDICPDKCLDIPRGKLQVAGGRLRVAGYGWLRVAGYGWQAAGGRPFVQTDVQTNVRTFPVLGCSMVGSA